MFKIFLDETLITVRGLGLCMRYNYKTQEFARIIFVDNLKEHKRKFDDYRPLEKRPIYEIQDVLKIVCSIIIDRVTVESDQTNKLLLLIADFE